MIQLRGDAVADIDGSQKQGFYVFDNKVAFAMRVLIYPHHLLTRIIEGTSKGGNESIESKCKQNKIRFQILLRM